MLLLHRIGLYYCTHFHRLLLIIVASSGRGDRALLGTNFEGLLSEKPVSSLMSGQWNE